MVVPSELIADGKHIQDINVTCLRQLTFNDDMFIKQLLDAVANGLLKLFMLRKHTESEVLYLLAWLYIK